MDEVRVWVDLKGAEDKIPDAASDESVTISVMQIGMHTKPRWVASLRFEGA